MDDLIGRCLLLASLITGAAICLGSFATAHYLSASRVESPAMLLQTSMVPARKPVARPGDVDDDLVTSSIRPAAPSLTKSGGSVALPRP